LELVGGIALILGLGTRILSGLLAVVMLVATVKVKWANGFLGGEAVPGYELDVLLLVMLLALCVGVSSRLALDRVRFSRNENRREIGT
jgi:putative oxidoreductase